MIHWERDLDNNEALRKVSSTHDLLNVMKGHAMVMVIRIINIAEIKFEGKVPYCVSAHNESHSLTSLTSLTSLNSLTHKSLQVC